MMEHIGLYTQLTSFTTEHAGTAEWCRAERDGMEYFVKKFHSPVYPSKDIGLPEKMYAAGVEEFHKSLNRKRELYQRLRECDQSGALVVPVEVMNYQFHICTISDYIVSNVDPAHICLLSEWQRLVLMRTLTLALMNVHKAGVVHSDMKPDNVLVTQDDKGNCRLRLIDFDGSFFESDPPTDSEDVVGDPTFFAPEAYMQSMDDDIRLDHRIDIFALGIIFHYFWSGKYPEKPEKQTIGESLLRDETVTIDDSIPMVLQQLIRRMISKEPEKRISLKSVYDVLGVQIELYPSKIVNIQRKTAEPRKRKKVEIRIDCCNEDGELLKYKTLSLPVGSKGVVYAEEIDGYQVIGPDKKEVQVKGNGFVNPPVVFTYKIKKATKADHPSKAWQVFKIIIILFIIYLAVVFVMSQAAKGSNDYNSAKRFMDALPLYSVIVPDDYNNTVMEIKKQTWDGIYTKAVEYYRNGDYQRASSLLASIEESPYRETETYMTFCQAHISGVSDYYSTFMRFIYFEDAKTLLAENDVLFCQYMTGTWEYEGTSSGMVTISRNNNGGYTISGMPELPDGGTIRILKGVWKYKASETDAWKDIFNITIESRTRFVLSAIQNEHIYYYHKL